MSDLLEPAAMHRLASVPIEWYWYPAPYQLYFRVYIFDKYERLECASCGSCGSCEWQVILGIRFLCAHLFTLYTKHNDLSWRLKASSIFRKQIWCSTTGHRHLLIQLEQVHWNKDSCARTRYCRSTIVILKQTIQGPETDPQYYITLR